MPPFRQPASDKEEWTPPDYAKPIQASSSEEWKPPDYATPVKKEAKKPTGSYIPEFLKPAKTIKPTGSLLPGFLKPSTEPIPYESDEEKAAKSKPEEKGLFSRAVESASKFLSEHPKIREAGQRFLTGTSPEFEAEAKKRGVTNIQGPELMKVPGVEGLASAVREKGIRTGDYALGAAGSVAADVIGLLEGGFDPRTAGIKGPKVAPKPIEAAEINNKLEDFMKKNPRATMSNLEEFIKTIREPIRRSREIPYRMEEPVDIPKPAAKPDMEKFSQSVAEQTAPKVAEAPTEEVASSQGKVDRIGGLEIRSGGMELSSDAELEQFLDSSNAETRAMAAAEVKRRYTKPQTAAIEEKKPFVSPFEKKAEKPLEQTFGEFGGVGHPDEPEYANKVLKRAGAGEPGLAVEPVEGLDNVNHVVYRNKDGEPIAAAMVVKDQSGKTLVQDLAADKSKGLLTGRAMKALGGKLEELGATESSGTMSADAENFLAKMKSRKSSKALEPEIVEPGKGMKTMDEFIEEGHKVPNFNERAKNGSVWIDNLYGKGAGGYGSEKEIAFINDTNKMKRNAGQIVPDEFKAPKTEWKPPEYAKPVEAISTEQRQQLTDLGYMKNAIDRMTPQEATNLVNARMQASKGGWATTPEELRSYGLTKEPEAPKGIAVNASGESAASQEAINRQASMKAKGEQYVVYDRAGNARPLIGPEAVDYQPRPGETFGIITPTRGFRVLESRGGKIPGRAGLAEFITSESGGMRWEGPVPGGGEPFEGPQGRVLNKLFNALEDAKSKIGEQEVINKAERARRFAASASVKEEGAAGAAKSLSKLRGEFEKVNPGERLQLDQKDTDSLFTAIKRANITEPEKDRGYAALFKLLTGEKTPVRSDLQVLNDVFGNGFADKVIEMHGGLGMVGLKVSKLASTMKSLQNAFSLAPPVRHGLGLMGQKTFYPAARDYFKFYANKEFYNASMKAIEEHPDYLWARDAGLFMSKPGSVMNSEEEFLNSYIGNIPKMTGIPMAVGASQRSYSGFLTKARFDTLESWKKMAEGLGHKMSVPMLDKEGKVIGTQATPEAKKLANFINVVTGRGDLGSLNKITNELNIALWSPRMIASRLQMLNPKLYMDLPKGMRLEGLKSLLSVAALGSSVTALTAAAGAKVSNNILSTDFMKSRFGKHVIDPWGGFQQYIVAATRFLAGKTDSPLPTSRLDIAGRFLKNKESPIASLIHTILTAKAGSQGKEGPGTFTTQYGQPTSIQREVAQSFEPIFIQDIQKLIESEPDWSENVGLTAAMAGASLTGMAQEYPEKQKGKLGFRKMKVRP